MRKLLDSVDLYRARLHMHPFLATPQDPAELGRRLEAGPGLAYWMFIVPDLLALAENRARDPAVQSLLRRHRARAAGDRKRYFRQYPAVPLFEEAQCPGRAAAEELCTELFETRSDAELVAFGLMLGAVRSLLITTYAEWLVRAEAPEQGCFHPSRARRPDVLPVALFETVAPESDRLRGRAMADAVARAGGRMLDGLYNPRAWSA